MNHVISICVKVSDSAIKKTLNFLKSIKYYPDWYGTKNGITIMIVSVWKNDIPNILIYAKKERLEVRQLLSFE